MKIIIILLMPQVVQNLYEFLFSAEHKKRDFKIAGNQTVAGPHWLCIYYVSWWRPETGLEKLV